MIAMAPKGKGAKGGKSNAQVQNAVAERRLRPIYDFLDNGNNKSALDEANKVLKKQSDFTCAKTLKALALIRLNREDEASPILEAIVEEGTADEGALQAMTLAFRELQQLHMICSLYEKATLLEPTNEEFLSQLFMSYVRVGAYKKQQSAAMALYKTKPKTPYYFWAVMSVVLQAKTSGDERMSKTVILPLAERMIAKMEDKIDQEQETRLYLMVLEMQSKYEEALQVLEGPLGQKLEATTSFCDYVVSTKLNYQKKLEHWDQVQALAKDILHKHPDQWNVYLDLITSMLRLEQVQEAADFIEAQKEKHSKCRGPFLAQIELHSRLLARRDIFARPEEMTDLLTNYFLIFGDKPCCGNDLKLYLPLLEASEAERFFSETITSVHLEADCPDSEGDINRFICWHGLQRLMGKHTQMSTNDQLDLVTTLERVYQCCRTKYHDFTATVIRPYDNLLVLTSHILWEVWHETMQDKYFWMAVTDLSDALKTSPASYNLRLLLIKFLNQIGAVGAANQFHYGLELKHVQLDSMGYVLSRHIQTCGHFESAISIFSQSLKFFTSNYKDIIDFLISAYRCGSFDKVVEFIHLRQRLASSQHYATIHVERALVELLLETTMHSQAVQLISYHEIDPEKDDIPWPDLTDNRDFKVMASWDPSERSVTDDLISESFLQDQKFLKYRSLLLRSLAASLYLSEDIYPPKKEANGTAELSVFAIQSLVTKLEEIIEEKVNSKSLDSPIQGPDRSRLTLYVEGEHNVLLLHLLNAVLEAQKGGEVKEPLMKTAAAFGRMTQRVMDTCKPDQSHSLREQHLEMFINALESSSVVAILYGVCQKLINPSKKKKKSKSQPQSVEALNEAIDVVIENLQKLKTFMNDYETHLITTLVEQKLEDASLDDELDMKTKLKETRAEINAMIHQSYLKTFMNLKNIADVKIEYVKKLK